MGHSGHWTQSISSVQALSPFLGFTIHNSQWARAARNEHMSSLSPHTQIGSQSVNPPQNMKKWVKFYDTLWKRVKDTNWNGQEFPVRFLRTPPMYFVIYRKYKRGREKGIFVCYFFTSHQITVMDSERQPEAQNEPRASSKSRTMPPNYCRNRRQNAA